MEDNLEVTLNRKYTILFPLLRKGSELSQKVSGTHLLVLAEKPEPCFLSLPEQRTVFAVCAPGRKMMLRASPRGPLRKSGGLAASRRACLTRHQENGTCNAGSARGLAEHAAESATLLTACTKPARTL